MGSTKVSSPEPPQQPSTAEAVEAYISGLPRIFQAQLDYAPREVQQQVELAQKYALPLGQAYQEAQKAMYPETSAIQEKLANQAIEGMSEQTPDWMRQEYLSNLNANLGANVGSGIAADYASRGLMQQKQDWQNYYRNLGLSVAGRQPLASPGTPSYTNMMSQYTPQSVMDYTSKNYGTYSNAFTNMYNTNAQMAQFDKQNQMKMLQMGLSGAGAIMTGGVGGLGMMGMMGGGATAMGGV